MLFAHKMPAVCCLLSSGLFVSLSAVPAALAQAQGAGISGRVLDPSGAAIPSADIAATNTATGAVSHAATDTNGMYSLTALAPGAYTVTITRAGFADMQQTGLNLAPNQLLLVNGSLALSSASQSVTVNGGALPGATPTPTQQQVFTSDQSTRIIDRKQIQSVGPLAGAAQILSTAPGANVTGYGNTGATKYTVTLNGINQGWVGYGGFSGAGSLGVTFDGVPLPDPATGLWQSPTIPQTDLIQSTAVTYGPGDAADRWYTNIGGAVEFTPIQPTAAPHANGSLTYGSYNQKNLDFNLSSGLFHGWSTVLGFGAGTGNDFRQAPDGFQSPSKDLAVLSKTIKTYGDDSFEFAGYYAHGGGYRSQLIPVNANPNITVYGPTGPAGQLQYSQHTSGFYSTLPFASYNKYDTDGMALLYARQNIKLDDTTALQNLAWFMRIDRTHHRINDVYFTGPQQFEWNDPHTNTVGDRLSLSKRLPLNLVTLDGYYIHALYNSRNNFFNPIDGGGKTIANIGGKVRSTYFNQDDFAVSLQDQIRLFHDRIQITPGLRWVGFTSQFADQAPQDFQLAQGVVLSTACRYSTPNPGIAGNATDQGACPSARENRTGFEPSGSATIAATPWLQLYGGYLEALKSPALGGGGGLFQSVDPTSYHLARQRYYQAGFKTHTEGAGPLNSFIAGANYFHQNYANQEIDVTLANNDTISSSGTSSYHGVNAFLDDDPITHLHLFANASLERAVYTTYVVTVPAAGSPGLTYNGSSVPYVPSSTANLGAYYQFKLTGDLLVQPTASFQFTGRQHLFDNSIGAPSGETLPTYETLNLGANIPFKRFAANVTALNVLNKSYNEYEYVSSGSYFATSGNQVDGSGYRLAYPGAPFTIYGGVSAHF